MLVPLRNIKNYEAYRIAMEGFETQINSLMVFYLTRNKILDTATTDDEVIADKDYKKRIKECTEYALKNVSKYRYNEVLLYCSKDEIENMLVMKAETLIFDEYGDRIIQDVDVLQDQESLIDITNNINRGISREVNSLLGGETTI
jgi:hypothetical protein